jgi:hypothetical protein
MKETLMKIPIYVFRRNPTLDGLEAWNLNNFVRSEQQINGDRR